MLSAETAGLLLGGLLALRVRPARPLRLATSTTFAFTPPLLLLAAGAPLGLLLAAMLLCGVATTVFELLWATALQQHVPAHALSRVSSYEVLGSVVLTPVVLTAAGPASTVLGTSTPLLIGAALMAGVTTAALASSSVRRLPADPAPTSWRPPDQQDEQAVRVRPVIPRCTGARSSRRE